MAVDAEFRDYALEQLAPLAPIRHRAMFGGVGLYADELFFALIAGDGLYFKVDDTNRGDFEAAGMEQFGNMHYYRVPDEVLDDLATLHDWVQKAVAVARRAKTKKR